MADRELPRIPLDEASEDWLKKSRLAALRARGWQGTLRDWVRRAEELDMDPLDRVPPITS